jgi:hypothetical protein
LCEAIRIFVRYDTPDENKKTRRDRNEAVNEPSPLLVIPSEGQYLWDWFQEISSGLRRVADGVCFPIPWSEFLAWSEVTQNIVYAAEYGVLHAIDVAFCDEMNKELQAFQERQRDKQRDEVEAARTGGRGRARRGK